MENINIPRKNYVYLDGYQPIAFEHSLIIQTPNKLTIFNFDDDTVVSRAGTIEQVYDYGKYFVISDHNNLKGVMR